MQSILVCAMKRLHIRKLLANFRICGHFIVAKVDISFLIMRIFFAYATPTISPKGHGSETEIMTDPSNRPTDLRVKLMIQ